MYLKQKSSLRYEAHKMVNIKTVVFRNVMLCGMVDELAASILIVEDEES
jgi:hypothetical protein